MKVILLKNVDKVGKVGEIKEVSAGFASNFLIPNQMAKPASTNVIKEVEKQVKKQEIIESKLLEQFRELAKKIDGQEFTIEQKAKNGKLFGSVKEKDLVELVKEKGFEIEEKNIIFTEPIKETGEFVVEIKIKEDIKAKIKLIVQEK